MLVEYEEQDYNPIPDMDRMIADVNRNFLSQRIEYFVMDGYTFDRWRKNILEYIEIPMAATQEAFNYHGIPIAVVASMNKIDRRFVTVVHGYEEL